MSFLNFMHVQQSKEKSFKNIVEQISRLNKKNIVFQKDIDFLNP